MSNRDGPGLFARIDPFPPIGSRPAGFSLRPACWLICRSEYGNWDASCPYFSVPVAGSPVH